MHNRNRKLFGTVVMVLFVILYSLIAMALAQSDPVHDANLWVQTLIYAVLGLAWILPLMPLIKWMDLRRPA